MAYINVDIDIDDVLDDLTPREKQQLVDDLYEDGYIPTEIEKKRRKELVSAAESEFQDALEKLNGKWNSLTKSEEEIIIAIAKRF